MAPWQLSFRRAQVAGFWAVLTPLVALAAAVLAASLSLRAPAAWGSGSAIALIAPGLVSRSWFGFGVRVWNGCAWRTAAVLRAYVTAVAYYLVVVPVGWSTANRLGLRDADARGWTGVHDDSVDPAGVRPLPAAPGTWFGSLCAYAGGGGWWSLALAPALWTLAQLGDGHRESAPPSSTYTLY
jgi:hypothetical protein